MTRDGYRVESLQLCPAGRVPNSRFPVLIHREAVTAAPGTDPASAIEDLFRRYDWLNDWRYPGIYDYYYFHSTSHEVLGVAGG